MATVTRRGAGTPGALTTSDPQATGTSDFYILEWLVLDGYCAIFSVPEGMPKIHKPARGIRMGAEYPDGLRFNMTKQEPGLKIADVIPNAVNYFMVSKRMKELLMQHSGAEIEFLRFVLLNHRGRVANEDCYIANVVGMQDCVDMEKTEGDPDPLKPDRFMYLRRLLLQEDKVPPGAKLFRTAAAPPADDCPQGPQGTAREGRRHGHHLVSRGLRGGHRAMSHDAVAIARLNRCVNGSDRGLRASHRAAPARLWGGSSNRPMDTPGGAWVSSLP
ncbi:hypothetical protein HV824_18640 [Myxococcus sp. AM009]|uniref:imm11 family protein n=1 Tax=Myxococcus sp. AM009 TaxID=2745137 RepID=UPI0015954E0A|nr:DUF1629 domain-containing protein [Myxococcus sp. AM009]NVJ00130.1 hypothetical protein [Myxococcus sp. AM009]